MTICTIRPFEVEPQLRSLSGAFPEPDRLKVALSALSKQGFEAVARLWVTEGIPFAFRDCPAIYESMRGWLGWKLQVHAKQITIIGSARIGYSLAPDPDFGRPFATRSDLDLSIISSDLFGKLEGAFQDFKEKVRGGRLVPASERQRIFWDENLKFGERNFPKGFFDANKIPTFEQFPMAKHIGQAMWLLTKKLEATPSAPKVRKASVRAFRDWQSFVNRVALNLHSASDSFRSRI